jgi:hypothetical protein
VGKYLNIVREVRKRELERAEPEPDIRDGAAPPSLESPNARKLLDAGWKPKVSFGGKVIWQRPDNGFYCSEESALHFVKQADETLKELPGKRGKGKEVTQH